MRGQTPHRKAKAAVLRARVNRCASERRPEVPSVSKNLRPATPSRAPGSSLGRRYDFAAVPPDLDAVPACARPCGLCRPGPPFTRPVASGKRASLDPRQSLADFCNRIRHAGTPDEHSTLARDGRHQPMPVALAQSMRRRIERPASHDAARGSSRSPRSTRVDRAGRGSKHLGEASA